MLRLQYLMAFFAIITFFTSCTKNPEIGSDLPNNSNLAIKTISFSNFTTFSRLQEASATNRRSRVLLGSYKDSDFGLSQSCFATQLRLSSFNVSFGKHPVVDSVILYLDLKGYYGDYTNPQTFKIVKLSTPLDFSKTYYSNEKINDYADTTTNIGQITTSWNIQNNEIIRIPLDSSFGNELLADSSHYLNDTSFLNIFNGLLLTSQTVSSGGAIYYFDLISKNSQMVLYYHNDDKTGLSFPFLINEYCTYFSFFSHDYTNTSVETAINTKDNQTLYVQSMNGVETEIDLSPVETLKDSGTIGINKATLTLYTEESDSTLQQFPPPSRLLLELVDETTGFDAPSDYYIDVNYFDGNYDATNKCYHFNISQYVQEILKGNMNHKKLYIFPAETKISAKRIILENTTAHPVSLEITYTKY